MKVHSTALATAKLERPAENAAVELTEAKNGNETAGAREPLRVWSFYPKHEDPNGDDREIRGGAAPRRCAKNASTGVPKGRLPAPKILWLYM
jgi:hypothetical protein